MKVNIEDFNKTKRFLVCVDSDGCAMKMYSVISGRQEDN